MVVAQKIKHRITVWLSNLTSGDAPKRNESKDLNAFTPMFIAALFIIAKRWKPEKRKGVDLSVHL